MRRARADVARPPARLTPGGGRAAHLGFPGTEAGVRRAHRKLRPVLQALGLDRDAVEIAELVLAEVMNNIVEHALAGRPPGVIRLSLGRRGRLLTCRIADQGRPFPGLAPPAGARPAIAGEIAELPEGGFGWFLIRRLSRNLSYRREGEGNVLELAIAVRGAGEGRDLDPEAASQNRAT